MATETGATAEPAAEAVVTTIRSEIAVGMVATAAGAAAVPLARVMVELAVTAALMAVVVELIAQTPAAGALTAVMVEPKDKMAATAQTQSAWDWNSKGRVQVVQKEQ